MDVVAKGSVTEEETTYITDLVFTNADKYGDDKYIIIDKVSRDKLLSEHGFVYNNVCDSTECAVETGKYLSAEYMIVGNLEKKKKPLKGAYSTLFLQKVNVNLEESEITFQLDSPIEHQLGWKMEAFFATEEQRTQYYKKAEKKANTTKGVGVTLVVGGLLFYSISAYSLIIGTLKNRKEPFGMPVVAVTSLCMMPIGLLMIGTSSSAKHRADFWASTLE